MADKYGVANLYGVATLDATSAIEVYGTSSLSANATLSVTQGSVYLSASINGSATVTANMAGLRYALARPMITNAYLDSVGYTIDSNADMIAHLYCQSSVAIIPQVIHKIKEGSAHLTARAIIPLTHFTIVFNGASHITVGNCYSPGYYEPGYLECTNLRAKAYIAIYSGSALDCNSSVRSLLTMDWTRNNTWKIGEICRIQQQLLTAVLDISKRGSDHLIADDVQPLFEDYSKMIFEVQNV